MPGPVEYLQAGLARAYENGDFTDFEIECGGHTYKVHKVVICSQSDYFSTPCKEGFAEGEKHHIRLKAIGEPGEDRNETDGVEVDDPGDDAECDDPEAIRLMIDFFYKQDYIPEPIERDTMPVKEEPMDDGWSTFPRSKEAKKGGKKDKGRRSRGNIIMHARVFAAAEKYKVPALRELSASKFADAAEISWDHTQFAEAARIVYSTTPDHVRELRDTVVKTVHDHRELLDKLSIENAVKDIAALNFELLRMARGLTPVADNKVIDEGMKCAECSTWLWYEECDSCSTEHRGCCGSCPNPQCPGPNSA
ncbi:hypothetical protein LTR56_015199 [Elasticomyces elasticus]|nr:hypothetical protein LTR56_015199 [Elasticomyces elasticus]KAK3644493.1 hypothetical protein LTR22_015213 [Elasticomyces elasticus]KAK4915530.1 hypothetical protein LTR49_016377 [Elasticomyces elasticus]KAK5756247.1 hypothetical protein LTS12_013671 [Elasticomyces elasticus]